MLERCKYLIISLLFVNAAQAQPFTQAPKLPKKVRQIIEWTRPNLSEKSTKYGTSTFDPAGHLLSYVFEQEAPEVADSLIFTYDTKGRLQKKVEQIGAFDLVSQYRYLPNQEILEQEFRGKSTKKVAYFKNGKKVEEKTFVKGGELGDQYLLKDRVVYNYNKKDSLFGEMHYGYSLQSKAKTRKWKVIHQYDPQTSRKSKVIYYNEDGAIRMETWLQQNETGQPDTTLYRYVLDGSTRMVEYKYKAGQLWQIIDDMNYKKDVRIYDKGRLVRLRSYINDKLFHVVDYQYIYYD
ncbi:MAG: hypothetical protein AAFP19_22245 [Bacteroidota bacterium]